MTYAEAAHGFTLHDADSHVMETADFFRDFADPDVRVRMKPLPIGSTRHLAIWPGSPAVRSPTPT